MMVKADIFEKKKLLFLYLESILHWILNQIQIH